MNNRALMIAGIRSARVEMEKSAGFLSGIPIKGMGIGALGGLLHAAGTGAGKGTSEYVRAALKGAGAGGLGEVGLTAANKINRAKMLNTYAPAAAAGAGGLLGLAATR